MPVDWNYWTEQDDETLRHLWGRYAKAANIAKVLGRTPDAVKVRVQRIGLVRRPRSRDREYYIYSGMLARCYLKSSPKYHLYGGAGVSVCDRWRFGDGIVDGVQLFFEDMGKSPTMGHSLDRIDNAGNYEPSNCRWATRTEQNNNRKNTRRVVYRGQEMPISDAVRIAGSVVTGTRAWDRISKGLSVEEALETPALGRWGYVRHFAERCP